MYLKDYINIQYPQAHDCGHVRPASVHEGLFNHMRCSLAGDTLSKKMPRERDLAKLIWSFARDECFLYLMNSHILA